jgi:hypothetical protein
MFSNRIFRFFLIAVVVGLPLTARAELSHPARLSDEPRKDLKQKALGLLEAATTESYVLKLPRNRIRAQSDIANLAWPYAPQTARARFNDAMLSLIELEQGDPGHQQLYGALRQELMKVVIEHDSSFALEFLQFTRPLPTPENANKQETDLRRQVEVAMTGQVPTSDPKRTLRRTIELLEQGYPPGLVNLVVQLHATDREASAILLGAIMKKLKSENLSTNQEAALVGLNLLKAGLQPRDGKDTVFDKTVLKELFQILVEAAMRQAPEPNGKGPSLLLSLQPLLPQVEAYLPSRTAALRDQIKQALGSEDNTIQKFYQQLESGSPEELLRMASQAPDHLKSLFYREAAAKLAEHGDGIQARSIINDNIPNPAERDQILDYVDGRVLQATANRGAMDEALQGLTRLRSLEERATMLLKWAGMTAGKGDKVLALKLLDEAQGQLAGVQGATQFNLHMQIAHAYGRIDPGKSFEVLETMLTQLTPLDGSNTEQDLRAVSPQISLLALELGALAQFDFDRAAAAATRFNRPETRIIARLAIAQVVLQASK